MMKGRKNILKRSKKNAERKVTPQGHRNLGSLFPFLFQIEKLQ